MRLCAPCAEGEVMVGNRRGCVPKDGPLPAANLTELEGLCKIFDGLYGTTNGGRCAWNFMHYTDKNGNRRTSNGGVQEQCTLPSGKCPAYMAAVRDCNIPTLEYPRGRQPATTCVGGENPASCKPNAVTLIAPCGIQCAEGKVAAGFTCRDPLPPSRNQCDDNPCHPGAECNDTELNVDNTAAELCTCRTAELYTGNGAVCEAPTIAEKGVNPLEGADVTLVVSYLYTGAVATITSQYRLLRVDSHSIPSRSLVPERAHRRGSSAEPAGGRRGAAGPFGD